MFTCLGSDGFKLYNFGSNLKLDETFRLSHDDLSSVSMDRQGNVIGLLDKEKVTILNAHTCSTFEIPMKNQSRIVLSPCGQVLFTYAPYKSIIGQLQGNPNIHVFSVADGKLLKAYVHRQTEGWLPQWTHDSALCVMRVDGEIHLYSNNQFDEKPADRLAVKGARHFVLTSYAKNPHIALFIPGDKGYPSVVRVFEWRDNKCHVVTNKSFYRADSARSIWNDRGTDLLVLTSIRSSNESYYGDQSLYYVTTHASSDNAVVPMPRKGSIYDLAWRPTRDRVDSKTGRKLDELFVVCYGDPPASITVFGLDCEPRFDFGTAYCNQLKFNPHGNLLLLAGLGNLPGDVSVWDFDNRERLASYKTTDISTISWFNDGEHLLMATVTPRLRVNNGFGVWHYGGQRLFFQRTEPRAVPKPATQCTPSSMDHELYEVHVLRTPVLPPAPTPRKFVGSATGSDSKPTVAYVPPALRNRSEIAKQAAKAMQMPSGLGQHRTLPVGMDPSCSTTGKTKKRKKPKASGEGTESTVSNPAQPQPSTPSVDHPERSAETKKSITRIRQKLNQIEKLKAEQAEGKQLDHNQMDKLATESVLRAELARLTMNN